MNDAQKFGAFVAQATEKDAGLADGVRSMLGNAANYAMNSALPAAKQLVTKGVEKAAPVAADVARGARGAVAGVRRQMPIAARKAIKNTANTVADTATRGAKFVGSVGQVAQDAVRHGANYADDAVRAGLKMAPAQAGKLGDRVVRPVQTEAGRMFGTSPVGDKLNPLNVATGAGAMYGAGRATGLVGGGGAEPTPQAIESQQAATQAMAQQQGEANPNAAAANGGLMGMWNSLPTEARYAIGAGVPLALAGAFMGGRGNYGLGGAMGALGLGAAGLGAAGAGMFGDGPRRMVGQGANALYNMVGGGGGNPMDQINALGKLSPEFGTTMLMGRDPNMSSEQGRQMYDFLTHNKNIIEQLMPQLQNASVTGVKQSSALEFGKVAGRCWTGYEPVPGKKPYSNDSCRPAGKKKAKKEKKAELTPDAHQIALFGGDANAAQHRLGELNAQGFFNNSHDITGMTYDPNNANVKKLQTQHPTNWKNVMAQTQGLPSAQNVHKASKVARSSAPRGKTEMSCAPSSRGSAKPIDDKQRSANSPVPVDAENAQQPHGVNDKAANLAAFGGMVGRGLAAGARGLVSGAGRAMGAAGRAATSAGNTMAQQSSRLVNAAPSRPTLNAVGNMLGTAGAAAGGATSAVGQAAQLAGSGAQVLGQHAATAIPAAGVAAYYAAGQPKFQSPVQFRSPIAPR